MECATLRFKTEASQSAISADITPCQSCVLAGIWEQLFRKPKPIPADLSKENIGKVLS
jgi:hypothetical protein